MGTSFRAAAELAHLTLPGRYPGPAPQWRGDHQGELQAPGSVTVSCSATAASRSTVSSTTHVSSCRATSTSSSNQLIELSTQLFTELTATVEVDMGEVTFFGSRAIVGLLHLRNEVDRHSGAELRISRCSNRVTRVLELSGVIDLFAFGPSRIAAELSEVA